MFIQDTQTKKGFSIAETIIAIAILSVAVVAPMTLAQRGLNTARYAKDQITAFYLAQEAVEYVRNIRDNNYLSNGNVTWLAGLDNCIGQDCGLDQNAGNTPGTQTFLCSTDPARCRMTFNSTNGIYGEQRDNNGVPKTTLDKDVPFIRTIRIVPDSVVTSSAVYPNDRATITVTVTWQTGALQQKSIVINEVIFNWKPPVQ